MTGLIQDIRYALRALQRAPGFAAVSIVTLALGIAATTIVYSIVDGILLRPLPIADPDRVMLAREANDGDDMSFSVPNYVDFRARQTSFAQFAASAKTSAPNDKKRRRGLIRSRVMQGTQFHPQPVRSKQVYVRSKPD